MLDNILNKVKQRERILYRAEPATKDQSNDRVRVISTFGSDGDIVSSVRKFEESLGRTRSFSESSDATTHSIEPTPPSKPKIIQFVKRTGASLSSRLVKVKNFAVGSKYGPGPRVRV